MLIDCDRCEVRGLSCSDCVVNVLLGGQMPDLDAAEQKAIGVLADAGMIPPLRLRLVEAEEASNDKSDRKKFVETWPRGLPDVRSAG